MFFRCGRSHFWVQKTLEFLKFEVCSQEQGGVETLRTFFGQGGGVNFRDFLRTSFIDGLL